MYDGSIFEIMIFFQIIFQIIHVKWSGVVSGVKNRCAAVDGDKILKSFSEYAVIQNQNPVARFGQGSTGGLQTEDAFSTELLEGRLSTGDRVRASARDGKIVFESE